MQVQEIWKCIHPRISYSPRALLSGNMILLSEYIFIFPSSACNKCCYSPVNSTFQTNWMKLWKWYVYCNKMYIEKCMRSIIIKNIWVSIMEMIKWTIAPGCWPCAIVHLIISISSYTNIKGTENSWSPIWTSSIGPSY
jgi:hypothetical protein